METSTLYALRFDVDRSIRYHQRRRAFFDRFNDLTSVVALVFGSASLLVFMQGIQVGPFVQALPAVIVTLMASVNLVIGSSRMARLHHDLARRFIELQKSVADAVESDLARLTGLRLDIERDEPPVLRVLDSLCHNDTLRAFGHAESEAVQVRWYQRLLAHCVDVSFHRVTPPGSGLTA